MAGGSGGSLAAAAVGGGAAEPEMQSRWARRHNANATRSTQSRPAEGPLATEAKETTEKLVNRGSGQAGPAGPAGPAQALHVTFGETTERRGRNRQPSAARHQPRLKTRPQCPRCGRHFPILPAHLRLPQRPSGPRTSRALVSGTTRRNYWLDTCVRRRPPCTRGASHVSRTGGFFLVLLRGGFHSARDSNRVASGAWTG